MPWAVAAAAVAAGGAIYASNKQSHAADRAAKAQTNASNQANDTQLQMYNQSREDSLPWLNTGAAALNKLSALYGLNTGTPAANAITTPTHSVGNVGYEAGTPVSRNALSPLGGGGSASSAADYSAFFDSPDYQFALQQGTQNLDRSAASRGRLYSGGYGQDLVSYGQGMAAQQLGNYTNRLASLANVGQTAGSNLNALGANYASQYGNNLNNAAAATASSYAAKANAASNMANGIGQAANYYANYQQNNQWGGV